jgi:uncharacterized protein YndB with AHSA1/START domain
MIDPLRLAFEVDAPQEHAFDTYTRGLGRWWPADHTHTGRADLRIEMEARVGGRIFERTPEGDEFDWGRVVVWEPPGRLVYSWHLRRDPHEATEVDPVPVDRGGAHAGRDRASRLGAPGGRRADLARSECRRLDDPAAAL